MDHKIILEVYNNLKNGRVTPNTLRFKTNPLKNKSNGVRPNSISIEDAFFGDSGKGSVIAKFNSILGKKKKLFSLRYNGGGNAGHETFNHGTRIVTHQLPMGVIQNGAVAVMSRGMLIHPEDLNAEIEQIKGLFQGQLPAKLVIDERVILGLDTHRAYETVLNSVTTGGRGSTGRGIGPGYASLYERISLTMKDLYSSDWKQRVTSHYKLYKMLLKGFGRKYNLSELRVVRLGSEKQRVGNIKEFINRLDHSRSYLKKYVFSDVYSLIKTAWHDTKIPFTLEGAQGAGLDPYHGVYPDVTASRPMSRNINDATYNVILPDEIAVRTAVMKTTYLSSVGQRKLPTVHNRKNEAWIQKAFDEKGRSTGRLRDIYPVSIPIARYLKRAAGYQFLVATHLDASRKDIPVRIITHYSDNYSNENKPYFPYQDYLNTLSAHTLDFEGWDGDLVKKVSDIKKIPSQAYKFLAFISKTIAPVCITTTGSDLDDYISFLP